ncbi:TIGR01244 family sulfur transferase [Alteromonas sp. ASW11-130]|uniref:TIGR01244 family sulfur transferase n=1 Tax=Alteromonas sp. ASW11-130 TaxID=3015775 RepID=UPI002241D254|nr:TIGR01244 family sulfur transferase [Alteromonas sp. ASW11-130]
MKLKKLSPDVAVSPQISVNDIAAIKKLGYRVIVCNRPDNEGEGQTNFQEINNAACAVNLSAIYQPVVPGKIGLNDVATFKSILREATGPVLAYCRTGNRSETLWSQATSDGNLAI